MGKLNYFLSSFLIHTVFIFNTIGAGLNSYVEQSENFNMLDFILTPGFIYQFLFRLSYDHFYNKKKFLMIKINENVLSNDLSPYLNQHKDNPVNWQTWSKKF